MVLKRIESNGLNIQVGDWDLLKAPAYSIRNVVFVEEQKVPVEIELDDMDEKSTHVVAFDDNERPIATARLTPEGLIGRMAVLKEYRGKGIGAVVLNLIIDAAKDVGFKKVSLAAQLQAIGFYENAGFELEKDAQVFYDANIPHKMMFKYI
ncbi:GNAT family N-acetyltransferase [Taylorella equigenitalis]|uniref:Acetyltransferase n=2 Tax=Taylorella equigenitalis TaxID=29575 RepID=A0A654KIG6_TAYEM|nr:GNAT family N-acetyltransferase [Taylorella equigenitalis]ADU92268.1 Acetyltransferase [Taylorella equigenitalis MCE9]AFN35822.1 putative acetyltransferase [Taylorella equigenitalis ATCC 35865]ASY30462.1 N-acetyltransferase [Taylorella equigenitalis]ASY37769.1 N-acetyltransferase [Taylorella equigenitalis]ASY39237.1 N-acetyltransferase [Taylorella equigenitalis]